MESIRKHGNMVGGHLLRKLRLSKPLVPERSASQKNFKSKGIKCCRDLCKRQSLERFSGRNDGAQPYLYSRDQPTPVLAQEPCRGTNKTKPGCLFNRSATFNSLMLRWDCSWLFALPPKKNVDKRWNKSMAGNRRTSQVEILTKSGTYL